MAEVRQNSVRAWVLAARPKTLAGAAVPVMIGAATAYSDMADYYVSVISSPRTIIPTLLCFLFAFIMQIDANFINDLFDYAKGTDDASKRLGPERACAQGWVTTEAMKRAIALTTCIAVVVGLPLILFGGLEMIAVGAVCIAFCFLYTTHLSYMGWGDVLVVVFFGIVPVCITYYIHLHTVTLEVLLASIACGTVIDALLMVNNFRDRDNDREVGKNTIVVRLGPDISLNIYLAIGIVAWLIGTVFIINGHVLAFILPTIYLALHFFTFLKMKRIYSGRELNACLGETARNIFIYGLTVSLGVVLL